MHLVSERRLGSGLLTGDQVIGTAIALNLLIPHLPLVAGCALSILDVFLILIFYRPAGSMNALRLFEIFVMLLVLTVAVCFGIQLSLIKDTSPGEVFRGYLPNDVITKSEGLYQACGILGATVSTKLLQEPSKAVTGLTTRSGNTILLTLTNHVSNR